MSSSSDAVFGITTSILTIPIGATASVLVFPGPYVRGTLFKYISGGSISVFGVQNGMTLGGTLLISGYSGAYTLGTNEVLSFGGPAEFYVTATGATAFASLMQGLSQNFSSFNTPG